MLGVHATRGRDDGPGIIPGLYDATLAGYLAGCEAELVLDHPVTTDPLATR